MKFRSLSDSEIAGLATQGCTAEDWRQIQVRQGFDPRRVRNATFSGPVFLGRLNGSVSLPGGASLPCGLYDSRVHNCTFADNVRVDSVGFAANYDFEEGVILRNVGTMVVDGLSSFANGAGIQIVNEAGGRELPIYDGLSAQIAYLLVMYRHKTRFLHSLEALIQTYMDGKKSRRGRVQRGSRIEDCGRLRNVMIGAAAIVEGALELEEGTIASCPEDPAYVGVGVVARQFVILSGSRVDTGAILERCFVGQGVRIGKQFSAENSAFFANCEGFHSEAVSLFAGPYSVTHHKSTLLIASYVSFFNAGSGTNQSNHMYKLGPLHQGVLERGVKTGSFSYLFWPSRVGAFTSVVGKHYGNLDTTDLPFSNLTESEGRSLLTPAMNLLNIGTRRDAEKWLDRDRRRDPDKLDLIHFDLLNPFTVGKMIMGVQVLRGLAEGSTKQQETVVYRGVHIRRLLLKICSRYYEMGIDLYLGERLADRLEPLRPEGTVADIRKAIAPSKSLHGADKWRDICGLLAPAEKIDEIVESVAEGRIRDLGELQLRLRRIHEGYRIYEWDWCVGFMEERLGMTWDKFEPPQLVELIRAGGENAVKLNSILENDAAKEFDEHSRIGYGIDGNEEEGKLDFEAVRGSLENNAFVKKLQQDSRRVKSRNSRLLAWLGAVGSS
jgi:hypothetical protein